MSNQINVNPAVLKTTRKSLGIELHKASELSGIPVSRLKQLETDKKPDLSELKVLAKAYNSSIASLLLYKPTKEKPLPKDRRTVNSERQRIFDPQTILAVRKARALLYSLLELKEELGLPTPEFSFSALPSSDPNELALKLRNEWNLDKIKEQQNSNIALEAYIEKIESLGVAVFQLPLTKDNLRGFSITDEKFPIIVIKRGSESDTAKNFTLFHELGHILLNEGGICDIKLYNERRRIEKWCNAFAGEILVPTEQLLNNNIVKQYYKLGKTKWIKNDLIKIANEFHVGPLVILRKLLEAGRTSKEFYKEKHDKWNKPSFGRAKEPKGRNIPREIIKEKGKTYISLALSAFDHNKINLKDLSDYLDVKFSYIPHIRQLLYER